MSATFWKHCTALFLVVGFISAQAAGDSPSLKVDHPSRYIVQKGDTLWDISGRFLQQPWRWQDVWQANPQIENPDLIYPGDEILLSYEQGRPIITVRRRGRAGYVRLSPKVRGTALASQAIPTIPVDAIQQFLQRPRVMSQAEIDASPYILSVGKEALLAHPGAKIYVRGIDTDEHIQYAIYRKGKPYQDPDHPGKMLGFESLQVGTAVLDVAGDPATLVLTKSLREVQVGDHLLPSREDQSYQRYMPRAAAKGIKGQILSVIDGVNQIGRFQTVVVNLGEMQGVRPGDVFTVFQRGEVVQDKRALDPEQTALQDEQKERSKIVFEESPVGFFQGIGYAVETIANKVAGVTREFQMATTQKDVKPWAEVKLPDEPAGTIMIYRPFKNLSYALVMKSHRTIHVNDAIKNP